MREFLLRKGKFEGIHNIYDNPAEFYKTYPGYDLKRWGIELVTNMEKGQWIRAEDDYIVQIMYIKVLVNRSGFTTWFTRFPMGIITAYTMKSGDIKHQQFYAGFTYPNKNSASNNIRVYNTYGKDNLSSITFVKMFVSGVHPIQCYRIAYSDYKHYTAPQMDAKINRILSRKKIMSQIVDQLGKAKDLLATKHITPETVVNKIKAHWDSVKPGSSAELNAIRFVGPLVGLDFESITPKAEKIKKLPSAQNAEFKEIGNEALPPSDITLSENE